MRNFLGRLQASWRLLATTAIVGIMVAALALMAATPVYRATTATFVSVNDGNSTVATALQGSLFAQDRVKSYGYVATSDSVMSGVIEDLGLAVSPSQLADTINVNNPDDTVILEISATNPNPALAQSIANSAAEQLSTEVGRLESPAAGGDPLVTISTTQPAPLPTSPSAPRKPLYLTVGLLAGLVLGVGGVLVSSRRKVDEDPVVLSDA